MKTLRTFSQAAVRSFSTKPTCTYFALGGNYRNCDTIKIREIIEIIDFGKYKEDEHVNI